jgi:hypothetical protein
LATHQKSKNDAATCSSKYSGVENSFGAKFGHILAKNWTGDEDEEFINAEDESII